MRAKKIIPQTFQDFYDAAPKEIQEYIDRCEKTPQSALWHPEGDVKIHIKIVFNRAKRTGDINLIVAAFFHDLGKADTTFKHPTIPGKYSAKMHEHVSTKILEKHRDWVESLGADFDKVHYLVSKHMRAKYVDDMREFKRKAFKEHPFYNLMLKFNEFDNMRTDYSNDLDD